MGETTVKGRLRLAGKFLVMTAAVVTGGLVLTSHPVSAGPAAITLTIGIDNAPPAGHNWSFHDYFPRSAVAVHNGDTLHFHLDTAAPDGAHTVTLGKPGEAPLAIYAALPGIKPDSGAGDPDAPGTVETSAFFGTSPPPGSGALGACGDVTTPCSYTGASEVNSGLLPVVGTDFYYKIHLTGGAPAEALTINYICNLHGPSMSGTFTIVPNSTPASTQADLDTASAAQYAADTTAAQSVESRDASASVTTNPNGTRTVSLLAGDGTADGRVQLLEMLPGNTTIRVGDTVRWTSPSQSELHTVTFPQGSGSNSVDPQEQFCENPAGADTPVTAGPPLFGCAGPPGSPTGLEPVLNPAPQGPATISSTSTVASSGAIGSIPNSGLPSAYAFVFSNPGTYQYQCRIHDHMLGTVVVAATAAQVTTPSTGAFGGMTAIAIGLVVGGVALVSCRGLLVRRNRTRTR